MLGFFLGADILPASPHLLLWQYHHTPVISYPWTCHQLQPLLLTGADCAATLTQPLHHLLSRASQMIPSQHSPTLVCASHSPSFMQQLISVSPYSYQTVCTGSPLAVLVPKSHCCSDTPTQSHSRKASLSLCSQSNQLLSGTCHLVSPPHTKRVGLRLVKTESETLA